MLGFELMNRKFSNERDKRFYDTYGTFLVAPFRDISSILCDLERRVTNARINISCLVLDCFLVKILFNT